MVFRQSSTPLRGGVWQGAWQGDRHGVVDKEVNKVADMVVEKVRHIAWAGLEVGALDF